MKISKFESKIILLVLKGLPNACVSKCMKEVYDENVDESMVTAVRKRIIIRLQKEIEK